jgi:hypothetical protein
LNGENKTGMVRDVNSMEKKISILPMPDTHTSLKAGPFFKSQQYFCAAMKSSSF